MPIDSVILIIAIIIAFGLLGATLAWGSTQRHEGPRQASVSAAEFGHRCR
jgi:hypothetical protein